MRMQSSPTAEAATTATTATTENEAGRRSAGRETAGDGE